MKKKIFLIFVGIVFIIVGIYLIFNRTDMVKRCTAETEANIIGIVEDKKAPSGQPKEEGSYYELEKVYYPVIEFQVEDQTINKKYSVGDSKITYKIGDKVSIMYDPNKPEDYYIKEENGNNVIGIAFIVIGAVCSLVGILNKKIN